MVDARVAAAQGESVRALPSQQEQFVRGLIKDFNQPDPARRRAAIDTVAMAAGAAAIPLLLSSFEDSTPLERRSCLLAAMEIGGPVAAAAIQKMAAEPRLQDGERCIAALVLGVVGAGDRLDELRELAAGKRPSSARRGAVLALGRLQDGAGLRDVLARLEKEGIAKERATMLVAVGAARDRLLLPAVLAYMRDDDDEVRRAAAFAVGELGDPSTLPALLQAAASERSIPVQEAQALALGRYDDAGSRAALLGLSTSKDEVVWSAAWLALAARTDTLEWLSSRLRSTKNPDRTARLALACAACPNEGIRQVLEELLKSSRPEVRGAAGLSLAARGERQSGAAILAWLEREKRQEERGEAILAAGALVVEAALPVLDGAQPVSRADPLTEAVRSTLTGRLDPRVLRDQVDERLREMNARLWDRREVVGQDLIESLFELDQLDRRIAPPGGGSGGNTPPGYPSGAARLDGDSSFTRDLEGWFARRCYLPRPVEALTHR